MAGTQTVLSPCTAGTNPHSDELPPHHAWHSISCERRRGRLSKAPASVQAVQPRPGQLMSNQFNALPSHIVVPLIASNSEETVGALLGPVGARGVAAVVRLQRKQIRNSF